MEENFFQLQYTAEISTSVLSSHSSHLFFTSQVNEAENQKKESWVTHQKMYKSYQEVEQKARTMQSKLKKSIEKAK